MGRWRGHAIVLVIGCVAVGGVVAAFLLTDGGHRTAANVPTTGTYAPITVKRPSVPVLAGGIPVDLDPLIEPKDFSTSLTFLPGKNRYRMTISNVSTIGAINSFQWYPPTKVHIIKLLGHTVGNCSLQGLKGFGGALFPGLVLHQNVLCDGLDLKAPSCLCRNDGGAETISFATDTQFTAGDVAISVLTATVSFRPIPAS